MKNGESSVKDIFSTGTIAIFCTELGILIIKSYAKNSVLYVAVTFEYQSELIITSIPSGNIMDEIFVKSFNPRSIPFSEVGNEISSNVVELFIP